jgi:hypothetical protein
MGICYILCSIRSSTLYTIPSPNIPDSIAQAKGLDSNNILLFDTLPFWRALQGIQKEIIL